MQSVKLMADQLNATGNTILDEQIISSILNGLNPPLTHFITTYSFYTRANEISFEDLYDDQLLNHEMLLNQEQQHLWLWNLASFKKSHYSIRRKRRCPPNTNIYDMMMITMIRKPPLGPVRDRSNIWLQNRILYSNRFCLGLAFLDVLFKFNSLLTSLSIMLQFYFFKKAIRMMKAGRSFQE